MIAHLSVSVSRCPYRGRMQNITVDELGKLGENINLIDIREPYEHDEVRVPFAKHIPLSELDARIDELGENPFIMCHGGGRSARTMQLLAQQGIETTNVSGGISAWEAAGLPVERG